MWPLQAFADLVRISRTVTTFSKQTRFVIVSQFDFIKYGLLGCLSIILRMLEVFCSFFGFFFCSI